MDTLIATLQEEITQLTGLADETENTLLLSLAGLKHVRDLKINLACSCTWIQFHRSVMCVLYYFLKYKPVCLFPLLTLGDLAS